jgi:hypothetical protein
VIVTRSRSLKDIDVLFAPRWEPWRWRPARLARRGGVGRTGIEEVVATSCDGESARRGIGEYLAGETGGRRHVQRMIGASWRNVDSDAVTVTSAAESKQMFARGLKTCVQTRKFAENNK